MCREHRGFAGERGEIVPGLGSTWKMAWRRLTNKQTRLGALAKQRE